VAADRVGRGVRVLIEQVESGVTGRAAHQGPEVDGTVVLTDPTGEHRIGDFVDGLVVGAEGVDLIVEGNHV
jgi:hypothetical protein